MTVSASPTVVVNYGKRRNVELFLVLVAQFIGCAAYALVHLNRPGHTVPAGFVLLCGVWFAVGITAHLAVRFIIPYADPVILPCVLVLNGLGLAMLHRVDLAWRFNYPDGNFIAGEMQFFYIAVGLLCFIGTLLFRDHKHFQRFPYVMFLAGLVFLLLPIVPGLGTDQGMGARVWIKLGPASFQPGEVAKLLLSLAFAGYLVDHREVLALAGKKVMGITLPRPRDLGPIAIMWVASILVLVYETDLGMSLLFFGLFVVMLYVATQRVGWVVLGMGMFSLAAVIGFFMFRHVKRRVSGWLDPFSDLDLNGQIINAQFGADWGGLLGRGWGLGSPIFTPLASSDMIFTTMLEEIGLTGGLAIIMLYVFIVTRGLRAALASHEPFGKLLATGLSFAFGLQVFAIIGGTTRLLPLTGLTTPFLSAGGSAVLSNWILVGMLLVISHQARKPVVTETTVDLDLGSDKTQVIQLRPSQDRRLLPASQPTPVSSHDYDHPGTQGYADEPFTDPYGDGLPVAEENPYESTPMPGRRLAEQSWDNPYEPRGGER